MNSYDIGIFPATIIVVAGNILIIIWSLSPLNVFFTSGNNLLKRITNINLEIIYKLIAPS